MAETTTTQKRKPYEASDGQIMESALMADSRHRTVIVQTTEDDPAKADFVKTLWRKLERESRRRHN